MNDEQLLNSWQGKFDELQVEGIYSQGYGIIPKYVMLDKDLTLTSKAIYALLCSYSGQGNTAYPSINTILKNLSINKDTYYKHRELLVDNGYITLRYMPNPEGHTQAIFKLEGNPKKFADVEEDISPGKGKIYSQISYQGLKSAGYGIIPKAVMFDASLKVRDKGLYAYFAAYAGSGNNAFPEVSKILEDLQISASTYKRGMSNLTKLNYIKIVQKRAPWFSGNDYYIVDKPWIKDTEPIPNQKPEGQISECQISEGQIPECQISECQISEGQISEYQKSEYISNNLQINNNLSININPIHKDNYDGYRQNDFRKIIRENIKASEIPLMYRSSGIRLEMVDEIVNIMVACCMNPKDIINTEMSREEVADIFLGLDEEHIVYVIDSVRERVREKKEPIKNIRAYYAKALLNAAETMELHYDKSIIEPDP